jgi:hypothetical protein
MKKDQCDEKPELVIVDGGDSVSLEGDAAKAFFMQMGPNDPIRQLCETEANPWQP